MILALWPHALQFELPALLFLCFIRLFIVVCSCFSGEPKQHQGRRLVDHKQVQARNFTACRPWRLFCFGSFGDFRCDVSLFIVILAKYI